MANPLAGVSASLRKVPRRFATAVTVSAAKAADAKESGLAAANTMLEMWRGIFDEGLNVQQILGLYRSGLVECRDQALAAYDEEVEAGHRTLVQADRKAQTARGRARISTYSEGLALLAYTMQSSPETAALALVDKTDGSRTAMSERSKAMREHFDTTVTFPSQANVKVVEMHGLDWSLPWLNSLKPKERKAIGFVGTEKVTTRKLGKFAEECDAQHEFAKLRNRHFSSFMTQARKDLGLPHISGNEDEDA